MARAYQPGAPGHVLITGASGGIGAALALLYAAPGVRLSLQGRDPARLEAAAAGCRARGAAVAAERLDVTDRAACAAWVGAADRAAPVDLAIANAGVSGGQGGAPPAPCRSSRPTSWASSTRWSRWSHPWPRAAGGSSRS